ncbi:MAG: hypothetical protein E6L01_03815 [Thaumarchaeota archaeon]|nr:MAG: hypothetical protein E6L01_03815 [Nitrososphaerota archaeon]
MIHLLVKVDKIIEGNKISVVELDIDNYGSVIPLRVLELKLPHDDDSVIKVLSSTNYAAIFTENDSDETGSTIILANSVSLDELNEEKKRAIDMVNKK